MLEGSRSGYIARMSSDVPSFLRPSQTTKQPSFLPPAPVFGRKEARQLLVEKFELAFPRVIDRMCGGETLNKALEDFPIAVERGAFMTWVKKDAQRYARFKEAKEVRSEVWAGEMVRHALAEDPALASTELDRSKFIVDTYKFLMKADNKREYGDTKSIDVTGSISITAALDAAQTRIQQVPLLDDGDEAEPNYKQLVEVVDAEFEDVDDDD